MSATNYTYFLTIGAVETQVYPYGDWSLKVTKAEEDFPFCKDYRIKFEGDFIFVGDDYDLIQTTNDCCDKIDLKIQCNGLDYWFGYFAYPFDLTFDEDRCIASGTPKPLDKYYYFDMYADFKEQLVTSDTFTYQTNFDNTIVAPAAAIWDTNCIPCEPVMDMIDRFLGPPLIPGGFAAMNSVSTFFENDLFPDATNPYPANNYVTGFTNKLDHVVMANAKDVCDPSVGPLWAEWDEMSFSGLIEILHNVFNTWWYIDENGDMRIEHIYFWELYFPVSYDLTTIDSGRWIINSSKYDYRVEEIPKEEQWNWSEHYNEFDPEQINYYDCYLPGKQRYIKEYPLSNITNDIEYIAPGTNHLATSPTCTDLSDSDIMFLRCIVAADLPVGYAALPVCAPDFVVWFSRYLPDGVERLNAHLSPVNLIANYWLHDRPLWTGYMQELAQNVAFESTWKNLRQIELSFPVCCDGEAEILLEGVPGNDPRYLYEFGIIFNEFITTQYGAGELYTGSIKDGMLSLQLIFEDLDCEDSATTWENASEL